MSIWEQIGMELVVLDSLDDKGNQDIPLDDKTSILPDSVIIGGGLSGQVCNQQYDMGKAPAILAQHFIQLSHVK